MKVELNIDVHYWNKETNYLFDFNFNECEINNIKTKNSGSLIRNNNEINFVSNQKSSQYLKNKYWVLLWQIHFYKDEVTLMIPDIQQDKTYVTVKHTFKNDEAQTSLNPGYKIKIGDQLKFGKMTLYCKDFKINMNNEFNNSKAKEKTIADNIIDDNFNFENIANSSGNQLILRQNRTKPKKANACRICLSDEFDSENPLITPCKCSGTMKYIHLDCLRDWLKSKISIKTFTHMISYSFKTLECELCLTQFPMKIKGKNNNTYDLIHMNYPDSSYMILEQVVKDDQEKTLILVMFKDKASLKVGRSNDSDVRLSDISISRYHANLHLLQNFIYIDDNDSKFGTLLQLNSNISFILNKPIGLQIGKHFLILEITKTILSMICCNK